MGRRYQKRDKKQRKLGKKYVEMLTSVWYNVKWRESGKQKEGVQ